MPVDRWWYLITILILGVAPTNPSGKSLLTGDHTLQIIRRDNADATWSQVNEQVDSAIPLLLSHLQKLDIEQLQLPDMTASISLPFFLTFDAGLSLTNGVMYNLAGIQRYGTAYMTYKDKVFLTHLYLNINGVQFEYNLLLKLMALERYGKIAGNLEDIIIYAELAIDILTLKMTVNDFRIIQFRNLELQLAQTRFIGHFAGMILTPISTLFKERITTFISDGLKTQVQAVMDDINKEDRLEIHNFAKHMLSGLTKQKK